MSDGFQAHSLRGRQVSSRCPKGCLEGTMPATVSVSHVTAPELIEKCQDLRMEVFVAGQGVPVELELEYEDESLHFLATVAGREVGTGRLRPVQPYIKFERVRRR